MPGPTPGSRALRAAARGDAESMMALARLHLAGRGLARDLPRSHEWYLKAAAQGHTSARVKVAWQPQTGGKGGGALSSRADLSQSTR